MDPNDAPPSIPEDQTATAHPPASSLSPNPITAASPADSPTPEAAPEAPSQPHPNTGKMTPKESMAFARSRRNRKAKGQRRKLTGDPEHAKHGKRMSMQRYEAMWEAWRDGSRSKGELARMFDTSSDTIHRVVEVGYPVQGWPSLRDRSTLYDAQRFNAEAKAQSERALEEHDEWTKARKQNLQIVAASKAVFGQLVKKAVEASTKASFTKYRKVRDKAGVVHEVEVPPSAFEMADCIKTLAQGVKELGQHESFWLGGPTERHEVTGPMRKLLEMTPEQVDALAQTGVLPEGLTDADLFGNLEAIAKN